MFDTLRDDARKAWAGQLLVQPELGLGHIAQLLGFADQSVLTRACQRWFGTTPRRWRLDTARRHAQSAQRSAARHSL